MSTSVAERTVNPIVVMNQQIGAREEQFKAALPAHIPVERFKRVLLTAVQNNPNLLTKVDRASFFNAAMRSAQDGLLPDGREGAIVEFAGKAQWMPMIGGLRKKVRNSGEIATWEAHVVYENDEFVYELGDEPILRHKPTLNDRGKPIAAYSIAVLKSGERSREVMSHAEIEKVRNVSRAKGNGPWVGWWEEMARKTVARRHSKVLPMSTDLDDLMRRDDDLYDMAGARERAEQEEPRRPTVVGMLDRIAETVPKSGDAATGEPHAADQSVEGESEQASEPAADDLATKVQAAFQGGEAAQRAGAERRVPEDYGRTRKPEAQAWLEGFDAAAREAADQDVG